MAGSEILRKIQELSGEREKLLADEAHHHADRDTHSRLKTLDHDISVLWDLRRRELAGERVNLQEDYLDRYDRYN